MNGPVLLTGATGFVGRQVLNVLIANNIELRLVVREGKQDRVRTEKQIADIVVTPDLFSETQSWWAKVCKNIDTVIHVAWYVEPGQYLLSKKNFDCLRGTLSLIRACKEAGVRRFVGVGTCLEYDTNLGYLSTQTPLKPETEYAMAKAKAFVQLSQYCDANDIEFAWCRLFYLFGDGEDERRLVPYLRARLAAGKIAELTSGKQIRDFLDVKDAGKMIAAVVEGDQLGPINICSEIPTTVRALAEKIADEYGRRDLLRFGARPDSYADPPIVVGVRETS